MYSDYAEAKTEIGAAIDFFNWERPHLSLGMKKPMNAYTGKEVPGKRLWKKKLPEICMYKQDVLSLQCRKQGSFKHCPALHHSVTSNKLMV